MLGWIILTCLEAGLYWRRAEVLALIKKVPPDYYGDICHLCSADDDDAAPKL